MSEKNPIRIFVTHAFGPHVDYHRVFEYLETASNFFYLNCSNPDDVPSAGGREALKETLRNQIKKAEIVLVLSSLYEENRDWVTYQMDVAQAMDLPIVALEPFGGVRKVPPEIAKRAAEVVGWNERTIADATRRQARHEDTTRWDVIDFEMPEMPK
ncbi:MAG TPA: TIR domain-containing protein [Gammaproteobacteria bacterium]|nr:TIR domain-containing protein [Gammaproteobacteria bacterium]